MEALMKLFLTLPILFMLFMGVSFSNEINPQNIEIQMLSESPDFDGTIQSDLIITEIKYLENQEIYEFFMIESEGFSVLRLPNLFSDSEIHFRFLPHKVVEPSVRIDLEKFPFT